MLSPKPKWKPARILSALATQSRPQISPKMYQQFALPYEQRIFAAVHAMGATARLHICGNITRSLPFIAQSGADIVDVDWMVDLRYAANTVGPAIAVCGNMDPLAVMLRGAPEQVRVATLDALSYGGRRCISAAGCEIPDGTPVDNLLAQTQALRQGADEKCIRDPMGSGV